MRRAILPLFSALLLLAAIPVEPQANLDVFKGCPLPGTAKSKCGGTLNRLKNRYATPTAVNSAITLSTILAPGNDADRWSTSDAAEMTGYVASVEHGGFKESCNCGRKDLQDIHINVVADLSQIDDPTKYVIAEITPRMQRINPSWTFKWAKKLKGKRVRFTGWMLFDGMHSLESLNTKDEAHQRCGSLEVNEIWRATAWEIHPVTNIEVVNGP